MKYNFFTCFDVNYIHRGLALYFSCLEHCNADFILHVLCLDNETEKILNKLELKQLKTLNLGDLNDPELLATRIDRGPGEFSWTCKPSLMIHALNKVNDNEIVAYLDADTFMYSSPSPLYGSFAEYSIMITPHRFSPDQAHKEKTSGIFNAGMIFFKKDSTTKECLKKWREQCIDWCYAIHEPKRFGDQMYLDEWPSLYSKTYSIPDFGVNLGPWSLKKYKIIKNNNVINISGQALVWYHFHPLKLYLNNKGTLVPYPVSIKNKNIYDPYIDSLQNAVSLIRDKYDHSFTPKADPKLGLAKLLKQEIVRLIS